MQWFRTFVWRTTRMFGSQQHQNFLGWGRQCFAGNWSVEDFTGKCQQIVFCPNIILAVRLQKYDVDLQMLNMCNNYSLKLEVEYVQQLQLENSYSQSHFQDSDFTKICKGYQLGDEIHWSSKACQYLLNPILHKDACKTCIMCKYNKIKKKWQCNKKPARNTRSDGGNKIVID